VRFLEAHIRPSKDGRERPIAVFVPICPLATGTRGNLANFTCLNLLVRQTVQCKNKIAQMLMEAGVSHNKEKLHQRGYFHELLAHQHRYQ
jgi:hypothetical protein